MQMAVVIALRNGEKFIARALQSVQNQSRPADEVWVVDDASEDSGPELVEMWSHKWPQLRLLRVEKNGGHGPARNLVFGLSSADWFLILDADDRFLPDAIEKFAVKAANSRAALIYGDIFEICGNKRKAVRYPAIPEGFAGVKFVLASPRIPFKQSACGYRRESLLAVGGYSPEMISKNDVHLAIKLLVRGETLEPLGQITTEFLIHPEQLSRRRINGLRYYKQMINELKMFSWVERSYLFAKRACFEMVKAALGR